ncbi:MAG TPA: hypothetical protein VN700_14455 [Vicinamibacterales bacterium]|nr:hypothetical protein [Vicinamibacterales bacterium]
MCADGILLASDTLYSGAIQSSYGPKLWVLQDADPIVVFGGAGTVGAITRARDEITRKLKPGLTLQNTIDRIDAALEKVYQKFPPRGGVLSVQAIVAIRTGEKTSLYENVTGEIALSPVDDLSTCLGLEALGDYFTSLLFRSRMPIKWAKVVAAHLVRNCKTYASGYCGGDTHLIELPTVGPPVMTNDPSKIKELEAHFASFDDAMRALLPDSDPNATDLTIKHRLAEFQSALDKVRGLAVATGAITGRLSVTLGPVTSGPTVVIGPPPGEKGEKE